MTDKKRSFPPLRSFTPAEKERLREILGEEGFKRASSPPRGLPRAIRAAPLPRDEVEYLEARDAVTAFLCLMDYDGYDEVSPRPSRVEGRNLTGYRLRGELGELSRDGRLVPEATTEIARMGPVALDLIGRIRAIRDDLRALLNGAHGRHVTAAATREAARRRRFRTLLMEIVKTWNLRLVESTAPVVFLPPLCWRCGRPAWNRPRSPRELGLPPRWCSVACQTARKPRPHKRKRRAAL